MRIFMAKDGTETVALKFPKWDAVSQEDRDRFMREVFVGRQITHPVLGGSIELAQGRQTSLYLPMPYHKGETLEQRLIRAPLRVDEALSIGHKIGRGLTALHRAGVIHRDINPRNVMVLEDGGIKIIDFGVSRLPNLDDFQEEETPGTADFMAPELFESSRGDPLSDQYALGVTLYRMLTARFPFGETPPGSRPMIGPIPTISHYRKDVPAWLDAVILRAMAPKREDRFGDIDELLFELEHGSKRAAPISPRRPLLDRNPVLFWQILCVLFALLLIVSLAFK
jgi:serine/threonine protein kinase